MTGAPSATTSVVYICGPQRSGTTILGRMLGSIDGYVFGGEVRHLWSGILAGRTCGCGRAHRDCELWSRVLEPDLRFHGLDAAGLAELQQRAVPSRHPWRGVRRFIRGPLPGPSTPAGRYARLMADLYRRIAAVAGAEVVVDSGKSPSEAALLTQAPDLEVAVVQVVRDPRATVSSQIAHASGRRSRRPHPTKAGRFALSWLAQHLAAGAVREAVARKGILVRYEDWVEAPAEVTTDLAARAGAPARSPRIQGERAELRTGHAPRGDGGQRAGSVVIRRDERWLRDMNPADRLVTTAITGPLLHRYGYSFRTPVRVADG